MKFRFIGIAVGGGVCSLFSVIQKNNKLYKIPLIDLTINKLEKMVKKICMPSFCLIILVLLINLVSAADVAYIYKSKVDSNIVDFFSGINLKTDLIKERQLPMDLSGYKFIFVGDEKFTKEIPIEKYPSVIINYYIGTKAGLADNEGVSRLVSTKPLEVNFKGKSVKVYISAKDSRGVSIPYYFLDNENKASTFEQYAGTYSTSSGADFGDVVSFADKGASLLNGKTLEGNICFFGIVKTDYWNDEAKELFKDCIMQVYDYTQVPEPNETIICSSNSECGTDGFANGLFCSGKNITKNYITYTCNNAGTTLSSCSSKTTLQLVDECTISCSDGACDEITCNQDSECNDGNSETEDACIKPGTKDSFCISINKTNVTDVKLILLTASSTPTTVTLNFSVSNASNSLVKGYLVNKNGQDWILVLSPATGYVFEGLTPSTDYIFYAKAIDNSNRYSDELSISVRSADLPSPAPTPSPSSSGGGGGGGGGAIAGGFSYCTVKWECGEWSSCQDGKQTRTCNYPVEMCKPEQAKPSETQTCTESSTENTASEITAGREGDETGNQEGQGLPITGAAIFNNLGKYSWLGVLGLIIVIGIAYYFIRKIGKA